MDPSWTFVLFILLFVFRYLRLIVGIVVNIGYKAYPVAEYPSYLRRDVSVIIPTTLKHPEELGKCLKSIIWNGPSKVFVVTAETSVGAVEAICKKLAADIEVLGVKRLNKRRQLLRALRFVDTEMVVFADDNVIWPDNYLPQLLAIFEDPMVGAGGTAQRVRRPKRPNFWDFLAIGYLERRVFNNITSQAIDGSISTLSGRTAAYRTEILKTDDFFNYFLTDSWLGRRLNSDDDKCLTRYVFSKGWKIALQKSVVIETTMESGYQYIEQCKRWARAHWRGNFIVMTNERYWRSLQYSWGLYAIYIAQLQTPAALVDGLLLQLLWSSFAQHESQSNVMLAMVCWILFTKIAKLVPHLWKYPEDIRFLPAAVLFSYLHGFINVYALLTLHVTCWSSQKLEDLERPLKEREQQS